MDVFLAAARLQDSREARVCVYHRCFFFVFNVTNDSRGASCFLFKLPRPSCWIGWIGCWCGGELGAPPAACDLMRCTLLLSIAFPLGPTTTTTTATRNNRHEKWTDHQNPLHQWPLLPRNSIGEIVAKWANKIKMYSNANSLSWHNGQWNVIFGGIGAAPVSTFLSDLRASRKEKTKILGGDVRHFYGENPGAPPHSSQQDGPQHRGYLQPLSS